MENPTYIYNPYKKPENYPIIQYSISGAQNIYINDNTINTYQLYNIPNREQINSNLEYIPQLESFKNDLKINKENQEDYGVTYSKDIIKNNKNIPEDSFKYPKDKNQNNKIYEKINKSTDRQNYINENNIHRINNKNLNTTNKIFVKDKQNYILYKDYNNIENNNNKINKINNFEIKNSIENIEKKPKDNYKNMPDNNHIDNNINNDLLKTEIIEEKEKPSKESNIITSNTKEYQINLQKNNIKNTKKSKSKITKNSHTTVDDKSNDKKNTISINAYTENTKKEEISINKIDNNNVNSLNNLTNQEINNSKSILKNTANSNKINKKILIFQKSNNNDKINLKHNLSDKNNKKQYQTKTNDKIELKHKYSFKKNLSNEKIKDKEKNKFGFLINEKKKKMFKNILSKNIDSNLHNFDNNSIENLSHLNYIVNEQKMNTIDVKGYENNTNVLEDEDKNPTCKFRYLNLNNKDINNRKNNKKYITKKNCKTQKNIINSNLSLNKTKKFLKTKEDIKMSKPDIVYSSKKKLNNKFQLPNYLGDTNLKNKNIENEYDTIILNTENNKEIDNRSKKRIISNINKRGPKLSKKNSEEKIQKIPINKESKFKSNKDVINYNNNNNNVNSFLKNLSDKKKQNTITNIYNYYSDKKIIKLNKKNDNFSNKKHIRKSPNLNQIKNIFSLGKIKEKEYMNRNNTFLNDKNKIHSTKELPTNKKFEVIKKYKFRPLTIEKKNNLKKRKTTYAEKSKEFAKLFNLTTNISEDEESSEEGNKIKTIDRNRRINTINNDTENDIINNKSFILDLNNVIPINDNKLIQSVNMQLIPNRNNEEN